MKSPFQRRLFRIFLFLSITPAIALTLAGYYLTREVALQTFESTTSTTQITDYYNNLLFDRIESALGLVDLSSETVPDRLDFYFVCENGEIDPVKTAEQMSPAAIEKIIEATNVRLRGFVDVEQQLYQYVAVKREASELIVTGLIHAPEYAEFLLAVQQEANSRSIGRRLQSKYSLFLALLFLALTGLVAVTGYALSSRLSRSLARPLHELVIASGKIAAGDFNQQVRPSGDGEILALIDSFNRMAVHLKETTANLAQSERVAAWRHVARRFAHELKNPLQPLLVSLYRIEQQLIDTDKYAAVREPLRAASEETRHLKNLADRFSHLAKLPPPTLERLDLGALVKSVADLYSGQMSARQFQLTTPGETTYGKTDAAYLREALHNLLQNAIDATENDGQIKVELTAVDARIMISVCDNGSGMDADTLAQVRLPYFTTRQAGTGLGLAIVDKSISELGGQVNIESSPGHGTSVTIVLPQERDHADTNPYS